MHTTSSFAYSKDRKRNTRFTKKWLWAKQGHWKSHRWL